MTTITISELRPSYLADMEASEINSVVGGSFDLLENYYGVPDQTRQIAFTPLGGTKANVQEALDTAIDFAGLNGIVYAGLHGGSFSWFAIPPVFLSYDQLA